MLIPNIFGKNDRYIGILPLSFWGYYTWLTKFSIFSLFLLVIGVVSIICQVYRDKIDFEIKQRNIKNTKDFSKFVKKNPLLMFAGIILLVYYVFTIIYFAFIDKDQIVYFLGIVNIIGFIYFMITLLIRNDYRKKIKEIIIFLKK